MLTNGKDVEAERLFFDFRVVDLAMGSGHFLVAAVDKVEALMRNFLTQHTIPGIQNELLRLAEVAKEALGDDEQAKSEVDNVGLLRRQVARRCIYGLDINLMAVELARLAMWIHTFVPGLPMSNLDHGLVCANSLTGIGTVDEALDALQPGRRPGEMTFFDDVVGDSLASAKVLLVDMANAGEADKKQVAEAAAMLVEAKAAAEPAKRIFDAAVATRIGRVAAGSLMAAGDIERLAHDGLLDEVHEQLRPAHMPYLFPEVFLRDNPGFDVMLGNPPWEKLQVVDYQWWRLRYPGLNGMPHNKRFVALAAFQQSRPDLVAEYEAEIERVAKVNAAVGAGPFPGIGAAHLDLSSAFAWRYWQLLRGRGRSCVVLPRMALSGSALEVWRRDVLAHGRFEDVCVVTNTSNWVFENVDGRYTIVFVSLERGDTHEVAFCGPFYDRLSFLDGRSELIRAEADEFERWSETAAFPLVKGKRSMEVFRQIKKSPRFGNHRDKWAFRPIQGDFNATQGKQFFELDTEEARARIPVAAGASFNLWDPDFGPPYAYAQPDKARKHLSEKLTRAQKLARSAYFELKFAPGRLPLDNARIAYRWVTNRTNSRTTVCCLLPPGTASTNAAPVLVRRGGDLRAEAFLLGVMSSIPFDWLSRQSVELNFTFEVLNDLNVPKYQAEDVRCGRVVEIAGRLAAVDDRYADWAKEVGVPVGTVKHQAEKDDHIAELDALVSLLYGLAEAQVEHIFATFHRGWDESKPDYAARLATVKKYYATWKAKA